jgi:tRNA(Ile)-lysidine synthase
MASSRKPNKGNESQPLVSHVAGNLRGIVKPNERVTVALSGGVDSVVLLDVLARLQKRMRFELRALHVNHQLSPHAAAWASFCRALCRKRGISCRVVRVDVSAGNSIERAAREARYAALLGAKADHIALAHNRDDQAETVLLRLLRGAGVKGLAAMAIVRRQADAAIVRPLLDVTRATIEHYARRRKLEWIEDESNLDARYTRNWLRSEILPLIEARVPAYRETLARAAANMAASAALLDDLARMDATGAVENARLRVDALRALSPARAGNLLRFLIAEAGWQMPDTQRLSEALRQATTAAHDATVAVSLGSCDLRRHGEYVYLLPASMAAPQEAIVTWRGERRIELPYTRGVLTMGAGKGEGLSLSRLTSEPVTVRCRHGGERLQPDATRPRRTVKNLLQEAGVPSWQRERMPFIYCGDVLVCIPGVAIDWRFRAREGERSVMPRWSAAHV